MSSLVRIYAILFVLLLFLTSCASVDSNKAIDSMSPQELETAMKEDMEKNPPKEMTPAERAIEQKTASTLENGNVLKTGMFEGRAHDSIGDLKIIEKDGETYLVFDENFRTDAGPDLHVVLTEHQDPRNSKNLHEGEYIDLGTLKSTSGAQTYKVPKDKVGKFNSASVYCKPFKVIFGVAKLKQS